MKIKREQDLSCNEMEITIKYPQKDKQVNRIISFLQSFDFRLYQLNDKLYQIHF